jgi:hypothetical protein
MAATYFFNGWKAPKASVLALMRNIRQDSRHTTVVELAVNREEARLNGCSPTWDIAELVQPDDIREVLQDAIRDAKGGGSCQGAAVNSRQGVEASQLP